VALTGVPPLPRALLGLGRWVPGAPWAAASAEGVSWPLTSKGDGVLRRLEVIECGCGAD
jgi:hypothetical protein